MPITKILLIDEPDARIESLLRRSPAEYWLEVGTLSQAGQRLAQGDIDAVLLHWSPAQELDPIRQLNAQFPQVPMILLGDDAGAIAVQAGAQDYLEPSQLDSQTLVKAIRYSIERSRLSAKKRSLETLQNSEAQFRTIIERNAQPQNQLISRFARY